jgi:putative inorganic carbon (HCO3(-)) transporter
MIVLLGLILALAPFYLIRFHIGPLPTTLLELLIVVFLIAVVGRLIGQGKLINQLTTIARLGKINYAIAFFILAGVISCLISPEPTKALGLFKAFILEPILVFYAAFIIIKTPQQIQTIIKIVFVAISAVAAFGIFQYFTFIHLPIKFWGTGGEPLRIVSLFAHPNALSLFLAPWFGFFLVLWLTNYPLIKNKIVSFIGCGLIGVAVLMTFSRGAWLGVLVGLIFILTKLVGFKKTVLFGTIIIVLALAIPVINSRVSMGISDPSSIAHLDLMKEGVNKIIDSPFTGNGLYGFRTTLSESGFAGEIHNYPHNIVLSLWVELGILGLIGFAWIIYLAFQQYKKEADSLKLAALVFLIILLAHGLVDTPYFKNDLALFFWFIISLFYIKQDSLSYSQ